MSQTKGLRYYRQPTQLVIEFALSTPSSILDGCAKVTIDYLLVVPVLVEVEISLES